MLHTGQGEAAGAVLCWVGAAGGGTGFLLITSIRNGLWKTRPSQSKESKGGCLLHIHLNVLQCNRLKTEEYSLGTCCAEQIDSKDEIRHIWSCICRSIWNLKVSNYCLSWHIIQMFLKLEYTKNSRHVSLWISLLRYLNKITFSPFQSKLVIFSDYQTGKSYLDEKIKV